MDFCAKETIRLKYPVGLANRFIGLGTTEYYRENQRMGRRGD